ncbi:unnamed protein product [Ostreobium quekettii]|uniref:Uncharacterized protein n=1 Tax=Ostreobium quekettii TaxID=121088 RepID=A0A8S1ISY6_9CHLO|nr:unnamed protein product [Ostreobium quekettii]
MKRESRGRGSSNAQNLTTRYVSPTGRLCQRPCPSRSACNAAVSGTAGAPQWVDSLSRHATINIAIQYLIVDDANQCQNGCRSFAKPAEPTYSAEEFCTRLPAPPLCASQVSIMMTMMRGMVRSTTPYFKPSSLGAPDSTEIVLRPVHVP